MKIAKWTDKSGYRHRSLIRDTDSDSRAEMGIPMDPPDLHSVDWEGVIMDLHNRLVDADVTTRRDLMGRNDFDLPRTIVSVVKPRIIAALRQMEDDNE